MNLNNALRSVRLERLPFLSCPQATDNRFIPLRGLFYSHRYIFYLEMYHYYHLRKLS